MAVESIKMDYKQGEISSSLKNESVYNEEPKKISREDRRKAKELEEARKAGTAPAAVDEEGKDINPHIPQYISATPWYFGASGPTLRHQRPQPEKQKQFSQIDEWYRRGVDTSNVSNKFRKGACENCGAITHKKKDCMERPRKVGAKFDSTNIAPDEYVQPDLSMDYDGKRDRWAGYDPSEHRAIIEEYQKIEAAKRQMRAEKLNAEEDDEQEDSDKDEDKYVDEVDMPGTKVDSKQRITVRNLRIREDTAKYLRNLDPNSAYYDPKTRSMRDNPHVGKGDEVDYKGENYVRLTGDTQVHANAQLFAWEAHKKGVDVHLLAEPTKLEMLKKEYDKKRDELKDEVRNSVINRYGGEEHLQLPDDSLLLAQTEHYIEYSRYGKIIKGQEKQKIRSKYEEDVYVNNHTTVWGSYWQAGQWGYKCCHSFIKNSYCTGDRGKMALDDAQSQIEAIASASTDTQENEISRNKEDEKSDTNKILESRDNESHKELNTGDEKSKKSARGEESSDSSNESSSEEDLRSQTERKSSNSKRNKRKKRKEKSKKRRRTEQNESSSKKVSKNEGRKKVNDLLEMNERKRPYNSLFEVKEPTADDIEAFHKKRERDGDPMRQFNV